MSEADHSRRDRPRKNRAPGRQTRLVLKRAAGSIGRPGSTWTFSAPVGSFAPSTVTSSVVHLVDGLVAQVPTRLVTGWPTAGGSDRLGAPLDLQRLLKHSSQGRIQQCCDER
jgi:hypothetical protein